ncbi:MAG: YicC family protein [Pirellulales bacterium]|nr:YicC family protein [Pirellulales bacterium]
MTGFGEGRCEQDGLSVVVEVRAINSRFFKLSVRPSEGLGSLEPAMEEVVRKSVRRGTIQVALRIDRAASPEAFKINADVLERYRLQLESLRQRWAVSQVVSLESLLPLPGVVEDKSSHATDVAAEWPVIGRALEAAMENLQQMRAEEGRAMAADLRANCRSVTAGLEQIRQRAPLVVDAYRERLEERLKRALAEYDVELDPADVIREVGLFAERGDISEEIVRLQSHLDQFDAIMELPESSGRKLEFLTQEMFREANTIGSKGNDVEIARAVIEIKTAIERIREMIQNIE